MGICVALQNETGETLELISDDKQLLHTLLPPPNDESDSILAWIDWYGTTMFNYLQIRRFLSEWDRLLTPALTGEEKDLVNRIRVLALRCQKEETSYLKFIGD